MRLPWQQDTAEQPSTFVPVEDIGALDAILAGADDPEPAVLLIHDPWCPISDHAYREASRLGGAIRLVVTDGGRDLTRHIEATTGIRHESPQAFVLAGGHVRWHASHGRITREALRDALASAHQG